MAAYLFAHFVGDEKNEEQIYFSVSQDGLHWKDLNNGKTWCLIADQFMAGKGYLPMVTENLSSGDFRILSPDEYDMGQTKKRHGGILQITDEEYERLLPVNLD